jgi:hypothetical protein
MPYIPIPPPPGPRHWRSEIGDESEVDPAERPWRFEGLATEGLASLGELESSEAERRLIQVGEDIGNAQRDGWLYANLVEELKSAALTLESAELDADLDKLAGKLVDRMARLGMHSATLAKEEGGPPNPTRSRPWRRFLDWLLQRIADVGRFLIRALEAARRLLDRIFPQNAARPALSLAVIFGLPPAVEVSVDMDDVLDPERWPQVTRFLTAIGDKISSTFRDI